MESEEISVAILLTLASFFPPSSGLQSNSLIFSIRYRCSWTLGKVEIREIIYKCSIAQRRKRRSKFATKQYDATFPSVGLQRVTCCSDFYLLREARSWFDALMQSTRLLGGHQGLEFAAELGFWSLSVLVASLRSSWTFNGISV